MKRIDVLKSIESILIEKAYEVGHRSQRKDGVYEKQQDGSWLKVSNQSSGDAGKYNTPQKTMNGIKLTTDQITELLSLPPNERKARQAKMLAENAKDPESRVKPDPKSYAPSPSDSITDDARSNINSGNFDDLIRDIEMRENDDGGLEPYDDDYFAVADQIIEQMDYDEDDYDELYDTIVDSVIDRRYALNKSDTQVAQEMNSRVTNKSVKVKNLGF